MQTPGFGRPPPTAARLEHRLARPDGCRLWKRVTGHRRPKWSLVKTGVVRQPAVNASAFPTKSARIGAAVPVPFAAFQKRPLPVSDLVDRKTTLSPSGRREYSDRNPRSTRRCPAVAQPGLHGCRPGRAADWRTGEVVLARALAPPFDRPTPSAAVPGRNRRRGATPAFRSPRPQSLRNHPAQSGSR